MREALEHRRAFNLIHYASSFKFDIFPVQADDYGEMQFRRRRFAETRSFGGEPIECAFATAEDTVLSKLCLYRAVGGVSQQQWNDLRGIMEISGDQLDCDYLRAWASRLGVADLLERLLS